MSCLLLVVLCVFFCNLESFAFLFLCNIIELHIYLDLEVMMNINRALPT